MKKPPYFVTDARHFLDENGLVPDNIPVPAKKLISFLGKIMEEASLKPPGEDIETSLKCRRRPSRKPCPGKILATRKTDESPILWEAISGIPKFIFALCAFLYWMSSVFIMCCNSDTINICGWLEGRFWGVPRGFPDGAWAWATKSEVSCGKSLFCDGCFLGEGKETIVVVAG